MISVSSIFRHNCLAAVSISLKSCWLPSDWCLKHLLQHFLCCKYLFSVSYDSWNNVFESDLHMIICIINDQVNQVMVMFFVTSVSPFFGGYNKLVPIAGIYHTVFLNVLCLCVTFMLQKMFLQTTESTKIWYYVCKLKMT
jgi:hypothetical protein